MFNPRIWLISLTVSLIAGAGYVINDIFDIEIDRINQPGRPLPSGQISISHAKILTALLGITGLIISLFSQNIWHLINASLNLFLLILYAVRFKKSGLPGNLIVSWSAASVFLYGAFSGSHIAKVLPIMCFAFLYTLIREWTKTIEDYEGDLAENAKTIAIMIGKKKTVHLLLVPLSLIIAGIFLFYFTKLTGASEFILLNLLVVIPLIFFYLVLKRSQHRDIVRIIHKLMKADMLVLLLIFLLSFLLRAGGIL